MKGMMKAGLTLAGLLTLAACTTGGIRTGSGPITLSPGMAAYYQEFLDATSLGYFAVTADGRTSAAYSYCPEKGCLAGGRAGAIRACESDSDGQPCYLFSDGRNVLWQGPVSMGTNVWAEKVASDAAVGPRTLVVDWQGQGAPFEVPIYLDPEKDGGPVSFSMPDGAAFCSGSYSAGERVSYDWALDCTDGISAAGEFEYYTSVDEGAGSGTDSAGRKIRLTLLPPA